MYFLFGLVQLYPSLCLLTNLFNYFFPIWAFHKILATHCPEIPPKIYEPNLPLQLLPTPNSSHFFTVCSQSLNLGIPTLLRLGPFRSNALIRYFQLLFNQESQPIWLICLFGLVFLFPFMQFLKYIGDPVEEFIVSGC